MSCQECVEANAAHIARFAPDLPIVAIQQLFLALYAEEPCLLMAAAFVNRARVAFTNGGAPLTEAAESVSRASPALRRKPPMGTSTAEVAVSAVA